MPPKKKGKSDKKKTKNQSIIKTEWHDLENDELEKVIEKLTNEHQISLQERIKVQTEYESIYQSYYESTKQNVSTKEFEIKVKEVKTEDMVNDQNAEEQVYLEKQQYVQYDHDQNLKYVNEQRKKIMMDSESEHESKLLKNEKNQLTLKMEIKERGIVYLEEIKNSTHKFKRELDELQNRLSNQSQKLHEDCNNEQEIIQSELDMKCHVELREMTEQNNLHLHESDQRHEEMYADTKKYYTNVSKENTTRLLNINEDIQKVEKTISNNHTTSKKLEEENKRLRGPLSEYLSTVETMKAQTKGKDKDKQYSTNMKSRIILMEERIKEEIQQMDKSQIKYNKIQNDIADMHRIQNTQKNRGFTTSDKTKLHVLSESIINFTKYVDDFLHKRVNKESSENETKHKKNNEKYARCYQAETEIIKKKIATLVNVIKQEAKIITMNFKTY